MAAFIFLSGDELIVHDNCQLMFHTYWRSLRRQGSEQMARCMRSATGSRRSPRLCMPFLSATDIDRIRRAATCGWIPTNRRRRWTRRFAARAPRKTVAKDKEMTPV